MAMTSQQPRSIDAGEKRQSRLGMSIEDFSQRRDDQREVAAMRAGAEMHDLYVLRRGEMLG